MHFYVQLCQDGLYKCRFISKSVITGFIVAPSEQSDVVIQGAKKFCLEGEGTVLMTAEASAFASALASLRKKHILCSHHFQTGIPHKGCQSFTLSSLQK